MYILNTIAKHPEHASQCFIERRKSLKISSKHKIIDYPELEGTP